MLSRFSLCLLALATTLYAGACRADTDQVTITLSAAKSTTPVRPEVLAGFNFGNWMNMAEFGEVMRTNVPPALLRFPGGNVGDDQDMNEAMLDTFRASLDLLKPDVPVIIQTRVFQGRTPEPVANQPEDAAKAVRLARERKFNVAYWQIGNEPDLYGATRGDKSWTPERYCQVFRAQAKAIKAEDPQARVIGPGVSGAVPAASDFLAGFVKNCGDVIDALSWHIYPTGGTGFELNALAMVTEPEHWLNYYRALWSDPDRNPLGYQRKIKFGMTEYGLSWRTESPIFLADMAGAMFATETALRMSRAGLDFATYFAYQGVQFHGLLDQSGAPRPSYYGFRMINDLRGEFVGVSSSDDGVWVNAVRNGKQLTLIIMNTLQEPRQLPIKFANWRLQSGSWFDAALVENEDPPALVTPAPVIKLPAQSMVRLEFAAKR